MNESFSIESWSADHPRYPKLTALIARLGQEDWVTFKADWHLADHMLVAISAGEVVGFLRYVIQEIGLEEDQPPYTLNGETLCEAKVIAFGVASEHRRKGIGRALQERLIEEARSAGLYQICSHSSAKNTENHRLKLSLGYAIHPLVASRGKDGAYFILPLSTTSQEHHE